MDRRILALGRSLREAGAPVSTPEIGDAERAALVVGPERRADLAVALRAALLKGPEHLAEFDALFERFFPAGLPRLPAKGAGRGKGRGGEAAGPGGGRPGPAGASGAAGAGGSAARQAPGEGDGDAADRPRAQEADTGPRAPDGVKGAPGAEPRHGERGDERGSERGDARGANEAASAGAETAAPARAAAARAAAERRRLLGKGFRERWNAAEERAATDAVEQLARRMATRLGLRRRRARRGAVDLGATLRANLVHGGVPFALRRAARAPGRRDLVLLVDVSGSVRRASALFLSILGRLRGRLTGVRAFAYVDRAAEVPAALAARPAAEIAAALAVALPLDALSDHGEALRRFNRDHRGAVSGRSVVVVLGDARNNRFPAQEWELEALRRRCLRLFWIVPEPASLWGSGDSAVAAYAPHCDRVLAAPNPRALAEAAALLLRAPVARRGRPSLS